MRADLERFAIDTLLADGQPGRDAPFLVQVPELASVGAHWHDYYEFGYVLTGKADHVVNGDRRTIGPGCAFLLSPVDFHEIGVPAGQSLRCVNVVLRPGLVEPILESVAPGGEPPWSAELPGAAGDVDRLCAETRHPRPGSTVVVRAVLQVLLVDLVRRAHRPAGAAGADSAGAANPGVRRAVRYVDRHFREPLTLAQVAAVAHLSPHWFSEQFRATTGSSFQAHLQHRRLQFARGLLGATDLSVTDACHAAGFNNLSHFGRAYRARYGEPPSARRR